MNVLILSDVDNMEMTILITSLVKAMKREKHFVTYASQVKCPFMSSNCHTASFLDDSLNIDYHLIINFSKDERASAVVESLPGLKFGFVAEGNFFGFYSPKAKAFHDSFYLNSPSTCNILQLMFEAAGLSWDGNGYLISYYPRNREKRNFTGLSINNIVLRQFLTDNLKLQESRIYNIPHKKNLLRYIDEINRCRNVLTDDRCCLHIALALRKNVEFLTPKELPYKIEMFGCGSISKYDPVSLLSRNG